MANSQNVFNLKEIVSQHPGIWEVRFDLPGEKVNKFNETVLDGFLKLLPELESKGKSGEIKALLFLSGKPGNFIAGADIRLIQSAKSEDAAFALSAKGQEILNRWEDLPFPVVAGIDGACMGGGCELALASTALVMSNDSGAKIGLPEVLLGLIPGMGGCVRMPSKIGLASALDLILTGKTLNGERAVKVGLADACLPKEDFEGNLINWVIARSKALQTAVKSKDWLPRTPKLAGSGMVGQVLESTSPGRAFILSQARKGVMSKTHGHYPAPLEAIRVLQKTGVHFSGRLTGKPRKIAMEVEAHGFGRMAATPESNQLIGLFFLTEEVKKSNGLEPGTAQSEVQPVQNAAVLGAGVMGGGIAQLFADRSIPIRMKDVNIQGLTLGIQSATKLFSKQVKTRRLKPRQMVQRLNLISPVLDYTGFKSVDLVIEAVVEKMEVKKSVLAELENYVSSKTVLASNTSSLSISEIQKALKHPERFVGMHFFNPVHKMPLVEVIRGEKSEDSAVATVFQMSKKLGKTPIVVKDGPGFLVNRLLVPYLNEAIHLVKAGVSIEVLDAALLEFGMPMGPVELIDEVGVDVGDKVLHVLHAAFGDRMAPADLATQLVKAGRLGKKTGKGFYVYQGKEGRGRTLESNIYEILGVKPANRNPDSAELVDRCILPMINEAARCLEEKVVLNAGEVDLGMIMGTGFPPFRGGLLRYADTRGLDKILGRLQELEQKWGARFTPSAALIDRVKNSRYFYSK